MSKSKDSEYMEVEKREGGEEEVEMSSEEEDASASGLGVGGGEGLHKAKQAITCRSVTLNTLMDDGVIQPGEGVLSIDYLGQRFEADLLPSGKIKWHGSQEEFGTPSAWALYCKRLVNPIKRSGCGWASVKYNNRKLDMWKSIWARKHRVSNTHRSPNTSSISPVKQRAATPPSSSSSTPATSNTTASESQSPPVCATSNTTTPRKSLGSDEEKVAEDKIDSDKEHSGETSVEPKTDNSSHQSEMTRETIDSSENKKTKSVSQSEAPLNLSTLPVLDIEEENAPPGIKKAKVTETKVSGRKTVSYKALKSRGPNIDNQTLVFCERFDSHDKLQPFTVGISTNALLLMDFHCHLTQSEVVGYLGGRWDANKQHLSIEQVFPALCRLEDKERGPLVEEEIRLAMRKRHMMVVGWYHSHPRCEPHPSVQDVDKQMSHQLNMRSSGSVYLPCLGFIVSPFSIDQGELDSWTQAFWVMPNVELPDCHNIPMHVSYSIVRDVSLTEDVLADMKKLSEFYSGVPDKVRLGERWRESITYLEKTRASLTSKLPEDQLDSGTFLDYVQQLLTEMK